MHHLTPVAQTTEMEDVVMVLLRIWRADMSKCQDTALSVVNRLWGIYPAGMCCL